MKLIVLDRDGVINEDSEDFIKTVDEWIPIPGSLEAIANLTHAKYTIIVVTNQSGLSRGYFDIAELHAIHNKMHQMVNKAGGRIDVIMYCPHGSGDSCSCRKPKPGMLHSVMERLDVTMDGVCFVGDSLRDLQAAMAVGATPVLVMTGKGKQTMSDNLGIEDRVEVFDDLASFTDQLLEREASK